MGGDPALTPARRELRADVTIWLAFTALLCGLLAFVTPSARKDAPLRSLRNGVVELGLDASSAGLWWPAVIALGVLLGSVAAYRRLTSLSWPLLQLACALIAGVWTVSLIAVRRPHLTTEPPTTYFGARYVEALAKISQQHPWLALLVVGVVAGLSVLLLNAAMQSLCGATQAKRLGPVLALAPLAGWYGDGSAALALLLTSAVLALSTMASERGHGTLWVNSLGLLSGILLAAGALSAFAVTAAGVGLLCAFFIRRRPGMILLAGIGMILGLLIAAWLGWSWPREFGAASAARLSSSGSLAIWIVIVAIVAIVIGGPVLVSSWRKVRATAAWPLMLTGLVGIVLAMLTRPVSTSIVAALAPWLPLLLVAAVAPRRAGGTPRGPALAALLLSGAAALGAVAVAVLLSQ